MIITFDDIINGSNTENALPTLYNCFEWINAWYLNVSTVPNTSGFRRALASGVFIILNRNGTLMNMTTTTSSFNMHSFIASSGYASPLHLLMQGIRTNSAIVYQQDITVSNTSATNVTLDWFNLTTLNFQSYFYNTFTHHNQTGLGYQFAIDNFNVTLN
jgi:hypothetical protein